jgi:drug/metabolite transporter (DMT)-like permease
MHEKASLSKIILVMTFGILAISSGSILIKYTTDVPPIMIATYRLTFSTIILLSIFKIKSLPFAKMDKKQWLLSALSGLFLAFHFITWITSLSYTSVASSVVLVTMNPIFVGLFTIIFFKEKMHISLLAGIILSVVGSIVLTVGDSGLQGLIITNKKALYGDILALTGALMTSFYLLIGSKVREKIDLMTYITTVYGFSALFLIIISISMGLSFTGYKTNSYIYMLLLAILPQLIGHTSFNWALKHLKSSMVAITTMGEPIGASVLAYFLLGESVSLMQFIGICLIFIAIILASSKGKKE